MSSIRRILVAVKDPAARTQPAVQKAAQLAAGLGARLELFHAICEPIFVDALALAGKPLQQLEDEWRDRHLGRLERLAAKLRGDGLTVTIACDWDYPAFEAVVRRAQRSRSDLIVAERHASIHLAPWLLRFNDWELLRRSPVPVLLVKSGRRWERPAVLAAVDPSHSFAKPAKLDAAIVESAMAVTEALRGKLHAVHAFVPSVIDINSSTSTTRISRRASSRRRRTKRAAASSVPSPRPGCRRRVVTWSVGIRPMPSPRWRAVPGPRSS